MSKIDLQEIEQRLKCRETLLYGVKIDIRADGPGGRYFAYVTGPEINSILETPLTVHTEGFLSFCERIAPQVLEIINYKILKDKWQLMLDKYRGEVGPMG